MGDSKLKGQVAVVTGGSKGIGAAIAATLAAMGAQVVISSRSAPQLESVRKNIADSGGSCLAIPCDIVEQSAVERLAASVKREFKRVDILVNNAGVGGFNTVLHETTPELWDRILNTNLRGVYLCLRAFAPMMIERKAGHIVNISSLAGKNALPRAAAYAASKWGLNGLSYSVAEELREYGIRVSVVCPGTVDTELTPHAGKDRSRMLQPADIAHAVAAIVTQEPQSFMSEIVLRPSRKP